MASYWLLERKKHLSQLERSLQKKESDGLLDMACVMSKNTDTDGSKGKQSDGSKREDEDGSRDKPTNGSKNKSQERFVNK